jgi:hypothetical protein
LSSCIFVHETNQVVEFERLPHVIVRPALPRLLGDVAVAGDDDVRNVLRFRVRFQRTAERFAAHAFDGEVGEDHRGPLLERAVQRTLSIRHDE